MLLCDRWPCTLDRSPSSSRLTDAYGQVGGRGVPCAQRLALSERQDRPGLRADSSWDHWRPAVSSLPHARFLSSILQIGAQDICAHGQDEAAIRASELITQTGNSQRTSNPHLSTRGGLFPSSVAFKLLPRVNSQNCQKLWGLGPVVHLITLYLRVAGVVCGSASLRC